MIAGFIVNSHICFGTLQVTANIGYWKHGMWNKLYDSLFIAMSENSDILAWQLTKGTSIDNVEILLRWYK